MKKLLALLLAMTLIFSMFVLASCGNKDKDDDKNDGDDSTMETLAGKTPEELYETAKEKLSAATSFIITAEQEIVMTYEGESMTMNQTVISKRQGDNEYVKSYNDMSPAANMEVWYVDGMLYANTSSGKIKTELDKEQFMQQYMSKDPSESTLLDIPESWFEDMKFEAKDDRWVLKFSISEEKYEEMLTKIGNPVDVVDDVQYEIIFDDDGNLEEIITLFNMEIYGVSASAVSTSTVSYEQFTITPPADADSYSEGYIPGM